jgi:F0F1-type ATP synthase delta subunit
VRDTTVARSYAEALFTLGERKQAHDSFVASLSALDAALQTEPALAAFLVSPKIASTAKKIRCAKRCTAGPIRCF